MFETFSVVEVASVITAIVLPFSAIVLLRSANKGLGV